MVAKVRSPVNQQSVQDDSSTDSGESDLEEDEEVDSISDPYDDKDVNDQILRQRRKNSSLFES